MIAQGKISIRKGCVRGIGCHGDFLQLLQRVNAAKYAAQFFNAAHKTERGLQRGHSTLAQSGEIAAHMWSGRGEMRWKPFRGHQ